MIPEKALAKIGENEEIMYWTRRARYEMVEEFSQGIFFAAILVLAILDMAESISTTMLWGLLFLVPIFWFVFYEYLGWKSEIHVVTEYTHATGGSYYKLYGPFKERFKEIPITSSTPDVSTEVSFPLRMWGYITGENQERVQLSSQGNTYIRNARLSPGLVRSIKAVRGSPAGKDTDTKSHVGIVKAIGRAKHEGNLTRGEARHYTKLAIEKAVSD